MASLRGQTTLFDAAQTDPGDDTSKSAIAYVGADSFVVLYIAPDGEDMEFDVEVAVAAGQAGLNGIDHTDTSGDGGLTWFKYEGAAGIAAPDGSGTAYDLSPFAPQILRIRRTDGNAAAPVSAFVTHNGPN
jgi:hypothetical protein